MTVTPLAGPFIRARSFTPGRYGNPVIYLGIHTAEGAATREDLGHFFAYNTGGSSHAGIDGRGVHGYAEFVRYSDTAWTNPPINPTSDTLEICGFAAWSRSKWLAQPIMLEGVAHWIAWRAQVRRIPLVHRAGGSTTSGVYGHRDINATWHQSDHTDPGPSFPWDTVMARAAAITRPAVRPAAQPVAYRYWRMLQQGSQGVDVQHMQRRLGGIAADGFFGPQTSARLKAWQRAHHLVADGLFGVLSQRSLG